MQIFNPLEKFSLRNVTAAFSRRQDGNMSLSFGNTADSLVNRKEFLLQVDINYNDLICAKQVHGVNIEYVLGKDKSSGALDYASSIEDADGLITDQPNVPIAILTADCLSIFIYDPKRHAIAILHAGWRSTEQNISSVGVSHLQDRFGSRMEDLQVGFGPSMRACCFEVEQDFKSKFPFGLIKREGRVFMDMALINRRQLLDCGVKNENIFDPQICTFSDDDLFSFRKEGQAAGRLISVAMLR